MSPQSNPTLDIEQYQNGVSDKAELTTSATVEVMINGSKRYAKVELKEVALDGEAFDDLSYRSVDLITAHVTRTVQALADADKDIKEATRSRR